jgi:hypothetical protein
MPANVVSALAALLPPPHVEPSPGLPAPFGSLDGIALLVVAREASPSRPGVFFEVPYDR